MQADKFKRIEDSIGGVIRNEAKKNIQNALEEEVKLTLELEKREIDFEKWKNNAVLQVWLMKNKLK